MRALILALLVGTAGCWRYAPPCPGITRAATAPGPAFLWRVQGKQGAIVWLFGTEHDAGIEVVPAVALAAFAHARRFVSELGDPEFDPWTFKKLVTIARGPGLDQQLGDDWWDLVEAVDREDIDNQRLARLQPWFALTLLNSVMSGPPVVGMDLALTKRAAKRFIPVDALETFADQAAAARDVVTVEDLRQALHRRKLHRCELATLQERYVTGDLEQITPMLVDARYAKRVLYARNQAWIPVLAAYLTGPPPAATFVAVGLGHMLGEQGLPALLARAGFTVTRVDR